MAELCTVTNCTNEADVDFSGAGLHETLCDEHKGEVDGELDRYGDALQNKVGE